MQFLIKLYLFILGLICKTSYKPLESLILFEEELNGIKHSTIMDITLIYYDFFFIPLPFIYIRTKTFHCYINNGKLRHYHIRTKYYLKDNKLYKDINRQINNRRLCL